ncbi:alpha-2-macroglobulin family protein, partial [Sphingobacterium cellulitidis]
LGERIKVVITVINDQDLEYVHLKDSRPAGVEPVYVPSGYNWRNNFYFTLKDASTNYFFNSLPKGKRTFEYEVKANNIGVFNSGITGIESMYDPTVNARSANKVIKIVK